MTSPTDVESPVAAIARAVGHADVLDELLGAVLLESRGDGTLRPEAAAAHASDAVTDDLVRTVLALLEEAGAAEEGEGGGARLDSGSALSVLAAARSLARAESALEGDGSSVAEVVCTLPRADPHFSDEHPVDFGFAQVTSRLLSLAGQAEEQLVLFGPFLESDGVEWILPGIRGALRRGVAVDIVTREVESGGEKMSTLGPLVEAAESLNAPLRIYDYYEERADGPHPLFTLHSKLLVVDERAAYVGSANFTAYGFQDFFEVGVVIRGDEVGKLAALCEHLIAGSADRVY